MSDTSRPHDSLPLSLEQCIDSICRRFEAAWQAGGRPPIESYLTEGPPQARTALLRELIGLELSYRRQGGESPSLDDYLQRFPEQLALLEELLDRETDPCGTTAEGAAATDLPSATGAGSARYVAMRLHAAGGLGEVHLAQDAELHREVALKRIKQSYQDDPESRRRFLQEAEITGRLEHPGIVPVYGLATDPDGQPCYAMRFIQGETLGQAIRRFHKAERPGRDPGERRLALRELLGRFIAVCNTMAYAHSRGVLHRDLKPANVMLGKYGETLVVDWGLAKTVQPTAEVREGGESALQLLPDRDQMATREGQVAGTPAYMSPEQAEGRLEALGPASDIYSLGAMLYELLTGRSPFSGEMPAVLRKVAQGEFASPRQVNSRVPRALEAVCLKAMSLHPADRYSTALELAADMEHWLADEPVLAYRDPIPARMARWGRRHRTVTAGSVVLLLTAVVGLAIGLWAVNRERKQTAAERDAKVLALEAEKEARKQTRKAMNALTDDALQRLMGRQMQLSEDDRVFLRKVLAFHQDFASEQGDSPETRASVAEGLFRVAIIRKELGEWKDAEEAHHAARNIFLQLAAEFPTEPLYHRNLAMSHTNLGNLLHETGRFEEAEKAKRAAREILQKLTAEYPRNTQYRNDLALCNNNLGTLLAAMPERQKEAEEIHRAGRDIRQGLALEFPFNPQHRLDLALSNLGLGGLLLIMGRPREAEEATRAAQDSLAKLVEEFPANPHYRSHLATTQFNLANLLVEVGRSREAEKAFRAARAICQRLAAEFPAIPSYRSDLATNCINLGALLQGLGQPREAAEALHAARDNLQRLATDFPANPQYRNELGVAHGALGNLQRRAGQLKEAEETYRAGRDVFQKLVADVPKDPEYRYGLATTHINLGVVLSALKRPTEADEANLAAHAIFQQLVNEYPDKPKYRHALAGSYNNLGDRRNQMGQPREAEEAFLAAQDLSQRLVDDAPLNPGYRHLLANTMNARAAGRHRNKEYEAAGPLLEQARTHIQAALQVHPHHPDYRQLNKKIGASLTLTLLGQKNHVQAAETAEQFARLGYEPLMETYNAACILALCVPLAEKDDQIPEAKRREQAKAYADRAMQFLQQAVKLGLNDVAQVKTDTDLDPLRSRDDFKKLLKGLEMMPQQK